MFLFWASLRHSQLSSFKEHNFHLDTLQGCLDVFLLYNTQNKADYVPAKLHKKCYFSLCCYLCVIHVTWGVCWLLGKGEGLNNFVGKWFCLPLRFIDYVCIVFAGCLEIYNGRKHIYTLLFMCWVYYLFILYYLIILLFIFNLLSFSLYLAWTVIDFQTLWLLCKIFHLWFSFFGFTLMFSVCVVIF